MTTSSKKASTAQRQLMRKYGIKFTKLTTMLQANILIKQSMASKVATENQIKMLDKYDIAYDSDITADEANQLIKQSMKDVAASDAQLDAIYKICINSNGNFNYNNIIGKGLSRDEADQKIKELYNQNSKDYVDYSIGTVIQRDSKRQQNWGRNE